MWLLLASFLKLEESHGLSSLFFWAVQHDTVRCSILLGEYEMLWEIQYVVVSAMYHKLVKFGNIYYTNSSLSLPEVGQARILIAGSVVAVTHQHLTNVVNSTSARVVCIQCKWTSRVNAEPYTRDKTKLCT